jgi:RND superfamily putative drug exporter
VLAGLSRLVSRRRRPILAAALVATALAGVLGLGVASRLVPAGFADPATQSARADDELERLGARGPDLVIRIQPGPAGDRGLRARTARVARSCAQSRSSRT